MRPLVRMIAQAHLDPVWLWRWTEGRAEALATSRSAVDRLREYPSLHFVRGEAQVYQWIEEEDPALFAEIRELIRQGRWHVVNGMVVQPDMNLPQGESFVRQALLGKLYMQEHLGVDVRVAYCVDSFGHAGTLPQILSQCGFDSYVFMRPQAHEKALPEQAFWWQAPDGSRILTHHISGAYADSSPDARRQIERALADRPAGLEDVLCFFGVGNHGGGPTRAQIESVLALARERADVEIRFDHPEAYFAAISPLAGCLPVVADELQFHATGCYSANSALKRAHRQAECTLLVAERMASLAELWAGQPPARARLHALWHDLLFNQFHDTLAGSTIKEAADEAIMALSRVTLGAREIASTAGRLIGARVDTAGTGATVLLFNPFPYRRHEYVEYEPWTDGERWRRGGWGLVDDAGRPVACQILEAQAGVGNAEHGIERLLFQADLPPLGYRLYRFAHGLPAGDGNTVPAGSAEEAESAPSSSASSAVTPSRCAASPTGLENDLLAMRLDPATGAIVSCRDRGTGVEFVGPGGWNVAQVLEDTSDTWSHGVRSFDQVLGCFGAPRIAVGGQGPLQASLFLERSWEGSTWLQQLILRAGEREILVRNWLSWQGRWRMVKLAFDVAVAEPRAHRDVPFGAFPCPGDGAEIPLQMWLDVSGAHPAPDGRGAPGQGTTSDAIPPLPQRAATAEAPASGAIPPLPQRAVAAEVPASRAIPPLPQRAATAEAPASRAIPPLPQGAVAAEVPASRAIPPLPQGAAAPAVGEGTGVRAVPPLPAGEETGVSGLAILNDGKYAGDVSGSTLRLTILRCPPYAYHIPHVMGTKQRYDWLDQGLQEFTLCLRPHLGSWRQAGVVRRARELNLPILPITMHAHPGPLPAAAGLAELEGDELELTALKPAEDGRGHILRIADRHGHGGAGRLHWLGQTYAIALKSHQVITLRLEQRDGRWQAALCDMLERPLTR